MGPGLKPQCDIYLPLPGCGNEASFLQPWILSRADRNRAAILRHIFHLKISVCSCHHHVNSKSGLYRPHLDVQGRYKYRVFVVPFPLSISRLNRIHIATTGKLFTLFHRLWSLKHWNISSNPRLAASFTLYQNVLHRPLRCHSGSRRRCLCRWCSPGARAPCSRQEHQPPAHRCLNWHPPHHYRCPQQRHPRWQERHCRCHFHCPMLQLPW